MSRKRFTPEQIIEKLREAEILINKGENVAEVFRKLGVPEQTCYRHRRQGRINRIRWLDSSLRRWKNYRGEVRFETRHCSPRLSWRPFLKDAPGIQETYPHPYHGFSSGSTWRPSDSLLQPLIKSTTAINSTMPSSSRPNFRTAEV